MRLVFSSVFEQDFAELVTLFSANPDVAIRFEENTYKLIDLLLQNPELGRPRKDLKPSGIPLVSHSWIRTVFTLLPSQRR